MSKAKKDGKNTSPSRSKSPKKDANSGLALNSLSDDSWNCIVSFLVPSQALDEHYIDLLEKEVKLGKRRRFTWISKKEVLDQIMEVYIAELNFLKEARQTNNKQNNNNKKSLDPLGSNKRDDVSRVGSRLSNAKINANDDRRTSVINDTSYNILNLNKRGKLSGIVEQTGSKGNAKKAANQSNDRMTPGITSYMEDAKIYIENKEEIPDNILMKIVKSKLLHIKAIEIEKKQNQLDKKDPKDAKKVKPDAGAGGKKTPTKDKKKAGPGPLPEIEKQSLLKKRDEIEEDEKFIDDEPTDGPNHYFILTGFQKTTVFTCADELNLQIDSIIKIKSTNYNKIEEFMKEIDEKEKQELPLKANLKITVEDSDKKEKIDVTALSEERKQALNKSNQELQVFWSNINFTLENSNDKSNLQNIARLKYTVPDFELKSWFDIVARTIVSEKLFNDISDKIYSLAAQKRQYKNYLSNLRVLPVPSCLPIFTANPLASSIQNQSIGQISGTNDQQQQTANNNSTSPGVANANQNVANSETDKQSPSFDMRYYHEIMDSIAPEYTSIPLVMYSIVEQVAVNDEKQSESRLSLSNSKNPNSTEMSQHLAELISNLALNKQDKDELNNLIPQTVLANQTINKQSEGIYPYLVNYHDSICSRLKNVSKNTKKSKKQHNNQPLFDPIQIEYEMLRKSPLTVFTGLPNIPLALSKERACRLQELLHFCTTPEITQVDVDHAFKQFIFESMNLTSVDENDNVVKKNEYTIIPWDDPYPNINTTLSLQKQIEIKQLAIEAQRKRNLRQSSAGSSRSHKSIKFIESSQFDSQRDNWGVPSGILKSRSSTKMSDHTTDLLNDTMNSVQSVHFDENIDGDDEPDTVPTKTVDQVLEMIQESRKRNLSKWNFAEHYDPKVFVQVLQDAIYTHPFIDTYYNRRDHSLMLVLSNPFNEKTRCNNQNYSVKLHSNVGLRNYLEKIYEMIVDWTRDEEAKYQASLMSKEVSSFLIESEGEDRSRPTSKKSDSKLERPRSKSDKSKKKESLSNSRSDTPGVVLEQQQAYITQNFVANDSLKAWKRDNENKQQDAPKKPKSPKSKSPGTNKDKEKEKTKSRSRSPKSAKSSSRENSPKKPKSRSSSKSRTEETNRVDKKDYAFVGYDTGNNMVYVKNHISHMFPSNGYLIKTKRVDLKTDAKTLVTSSVIKDGNVFSIHLVDPKEDMSPKDLQVKQPNDKDSKEEQNDASSRSSNRSNLSRRNEDNQNATCAKYSCFTGTLKDGFSVSFTTMEIKPSIKIDSQNIQQMASTAQIDSVENTAQQAAEEKQAKQQAKNSKKLSKKEPTPEPPPEETIYIPEIPPMEIKETPKFKVLPWSQLFLSTPTGLSCTFVPETYSGITPTADYEPHKLLIKQSYSVKCNNPDNPNALNPNIYKEKSRIIKNDGTVIRLMADETIEILYPNGAIYKKEYELRSEQPLESETDQNIKDKSKNKKKDHQKTSDESNTPRTEITKRFLNWTYIAPNGTKYTQKSDKSFEPIGHLKNLISHDYQTNETMATREDNVRFVQRPDGTHIVDYADGTRISTFYVKDVETLNDHETGEPYETSAKIAKFTKVECLGFASTLFNLDTYECTLIFGNGTTVACNPSERTYNIGYQSGDLIDINQKGVVTFVPKAHSDEYNVDQEKFVFNERSNDILTHVDDEGNSYRVDRFGKCHTETVIKESEEDFQSCSKHSARYFIIHKDSSATELLRFEDIYDYMKEIEADPMAAIMRDNVQGHPNIIGTTILRPVKDSYSDNWLIDYDEKDIVPYGLRCRNLYTFPPNPEVKVSGPEFGTNIGKGLELQEPNKQTRKVKNVPINIPKRMEYRQFVEYEKINEEIKNSLIEGLKNYINYVRKRAENHHALLAHDPRSEAEKLNALKILQLARQDQLFETDINMLYKLNVSVNKKAEIEAKSVKKATVRQNLHLMYGELMNSLKQEKQNKEAWRKAFVPSYFDSEWGRAFLNKIDKKELTQNQLNTISNQTNKENREIKEAFVDENIFDKSKTSGKTSLPPISSKNFESALNKRENHSNETYTFYKNRNIEKDDKNLKIPKAVKTSRPNAIPNIQFWLNEDPVRRKPNNSIVNASILNGKPLDKRRGCEVYPNRIDFGVLREGFTYSFDLEIINVGIDSCRFKIKKIPEHTGIQLIFSPGQIAPGMKRDMTVMLYAHYKQDDRISKSSNNENYKIKQEIEITTETDVIRVPIYAEIASVDDFYSQYKGNIEAGKNPGVKIISARPLSSFDLSKKPMISIN